jgi:hypothetical protein
MESYRSVKLRRPLRATSERLSSAYLLSVAVFAVHATYVAARYHYTVPHGDDWRILDEYFSTPLLQWLFTDQVGHRMPVTLLLFFLDYTLFLGGMHLLVIASLVCTWLAVAALYLAFRADDDLGSPASSPTFAFLCFCLFWAASCFDLVWGANQGTRLATMWFLLSLSLLALYQGRRSRHPSRSDDRLLLAAGLAALFATFGHGMGAASWASLNAIAIAGRFPRRIIAGLVVGAIVSVVAYAVGLQHVPFGTTRVYQTLLWHRPVAILEFIAAFVGAPVFHVARGLGWIESQPLHPVSVAAGAIGLVGFVLYSSWLLLRTTGGGARDSLSLGLMTFGVAGGLLVALNRLWSPSAATSIRFITWSTLFWMGAVGALSSVGRRRTTTRVLGLVLLPLISLAMLPATRQARSHHERLQLHDSIAAVMHLTGVQWDARARFGINPSSEPVYRVVARLKRDRRSFFADGWGDLPGTRLDERFVHAPASRCTGAIQTVRKLPARKGPAAEVYGRGRDHSGDRAPSPILIADAAGIIRGLGRTTPPLHLHGRAGAAGEAAGAPWVGFIDGFDDSARYVAHGVLADGRSVCRLASWPPDDEQSD